MTLILHQRSRKTKMLMFPSEYVQLKKYHGYVWNIKEHKLYSFKYGCLKELKLAKPYFGLLRSKNAPKAITEYHYRISHYGQRITIGLTELQSIKEEHEINYVKECKC